MRYDPILGEEMLVPFLYFFIFSLNQVFDEGK